MLKNFQIVTGMFRFLCLMTLFLLLFSLVSDVNSYQLFADTDSEHANQFAKTGTEDFRAFEMSKKEYEKESLYEEKGKDENFVINVNKKYSGFFYNSGGDLSNIETIQKGSFDGSTFDCVVFDDINFYECTFRNVDFRGVRGLDIGFSPNSRYRDDAT
ncbi:MAG: hypothetical protein LBC74_14985 [Planctomycetaceae bacterium]|jgi:uncharacterized protein YjbI with pentapeptide repeats|nr:hypothetical protein [Planctomycetaceae bacterium]